MARMRDLNKPGSPLSCAEARVYGRADHCFDRQTVMTTRFNDSKCIFEQRSAFQDIAVYESDTFGRILSLDGDVQLSESDECNYHESLAHTPMAYLRSPTRVLIIGGGDGGTLREVCKHDCKDIVMVEIDAAVVDVAKRFFPKLAVGFQDPRVSLVIQDACKYLKDAGSDTFDVIYMDVTDFNHSESLFTPSVVRDIHRVLKPDGIVALNFLSLGVGDEHPQVHLRGSHLGTRFAHAELFQTFQPVFTGGHYTFAFLSDAHDPLDFSKCCWPSERALATTYYTPQVHRASFALPKKFAKTHAWTSGVSTPAPEALGSHLLLDVSDCACLDPERVEALCTALVTATDSTELKRMHHHFDPHGYTIAILLAESHITAHTWPERKSACLDVFTCKKSPISIDTISDLVHEHIGGACAFHRTRRGNVM